MKALINCVREQYDVVLFDSAPVLGMTDAVVLATKTDRTVLVIKAEEATLKALETAVTQLRQVGAQVCGVALSDVDVRRDRYCDYYCYSPYKDDEERELRRRRKGKEYRA
jgi:Mrp family chromosome partitioning ATPase